MTTLRAMPTFQLMQYFKNNVWMQYSSVNSWKGDQGRRRFRSVHDAWWYRYHFGEKMCLRWIIVSRNIKNTVKNVAQPLQHWLFKDTSGKIPVVSYHLRLVALGHTFSPIGYIGNAVFQILDLSAIDIEIKTSCTFCLFLTTFQKLIMNFSESINMLNWNSIVVAKNKHGRKSLCLHIW